MTIPTPEQRHQLNQALRAHGHDSGFFDDHGRPAPWPHDIDEWQPTGDEPITPEPGHPPF